MEYYWWLQWRFSTTDSQGDHGYGFISEFHLSLLFKEFFWYFQWQKKKKKVFMTIKWHWTCSLFSTTRTLVSSLQQVMLCFVWWWIWISDSVTGQVGVICDWLLDYSVICSWPYRYLDAFLTIFTRTLPSVLVQLAECCPGCYQTWPGWKKKTNSLDILQV